MGANLGLKGLAGELLEHINPMATGIYSRSAADPLHEAAEKTGARIEGIPLAPSFQKKKLSKGEKRKTGRRAAVLDIQRSGCSHALNPE